MPWVSIDDQFADHAKVAAAGPVAAHVQVAALGYCNRMLTDGFVPRAVAVKLATYDGIHHESGDPITWLDVVERLVKFGMWEPVEGGYAVHDYLGYQQSAEAVLANREKARERMAKARANKPARSREVRPNSTRSSRNPTPTKEELQDQPLLAPVVAAFEEAWNTYPRHPDTSKPGGGASKFEARKSWARVKPEELDGVKLGMGHYAADIAARHDAPVAHFTTWINQRRWEDWQEPAVAGARASPNAGNGKAEYFLPDGESIPF